MALFFLCQSERRIHVARRFSPIAAPRVLDGRQLAGRGNDFSRGKTEEDLVNKNNPVVLSGFLHHRDFLHSEHLSTIIKGLSLFEGWFHRILA